MKTGYAIAKNSLKKEFFTSTSAYDRAQWIPVTEATTYPTAEMAESALKKLYKYGQIQARVVPLAEMNLDFEPIEGSGEDLPPEGSEQDLPMDGEMGGEDDAALGDEEGSGDDDGMDAEETGEVCPECEHDPCTCEDKEDDDELSPDDLDGEMSGDMGDDLDDIDMEDDVDLDLDGDDGELEQEADPRFDGRTLGMASISPMGGPRMESAEVSFKDKAVTGKDGNDFAQPNDTKAKVPANVKSDLSSTISKFKKEAEYNKGDDARASFCLTVASALEEIQELLNAGTIEDVKKASIKMTSMMNPITSQIPVSVVKYIQTGGEKPSLKDLFNAKRSEQK